MFSPTDCTDAIFRGCTCLKCTNRARNRLNHSKSWCT